MPLPPPDVIDLKNLSAAQGGLRLLCDDRRRELREKNHRIQLVGPYESDLEKKQDLRFTLLIGKALIGMCVGEGVSARDTGRCPGIEIVDISLQDEEA